MAAINDRIVLTEEEVADISRLQEQLPENPYAHLVFTGDENDQYNCMTGRLHYPRYFLDFDELYGRDAQLLFEEFKTILQERGYYRPDTNFPYHLYSPLIWRVLRIAGQTIPDMWITYGPRSAGLYQHVIILVDQQQLEITNAYFIDDYSPPSLYEGDVDELWTEYAELLFQLPRNRDGYTFGEFLMNRFEPDEPLQVEPNASPLAQQDVEGNWDDLEYGELPPEHPQLAALRLGGNWGDLEDGELPPDNPRLVRAGLDDREVEDNEEGFQRFADGLDQLAQREVGGQAAAANYFAQPMRPVGRPRTFPVREPLPAALAQLFDQRFFESVEQDRIRHREDALQEQDPAAMEQVEAVMAGFPLYDAPLHLMKATYRQLADGLSKDPTKPVIGQGCMAIHDSMKSLKNSLEPYLLLDRYIQLHDRGVRLQAISPRGVLLLLRDLVVTHLVGNEDTIGSPLYDFETCDAMVDEICGQLLENDYNRVPFLDKPIFLSGKMTHVDALPTTVAQFIIQTKGYDPDQVYTHEIPAKVLILVVICFLWDQHPVVITKWAKEFVIGVLMAYSHTPSTDFPPITLQSVLEPIGLAEWIPDLRKAKLVMYPFDMAVAGSGARLISSFDSLPAFIQTIMDAHYKTLYPTRPLPPRVETIQDLDPILEEMRGLDPGVRRLPDTIAEKIIKAVKDKVREKPEYNTLATYKVGQVNEMSCVPGIIERIYFGLGSTLCEEPIDKKAKDIFSEILNSFSDELVEKYAPNVNDLPDEAERKSKVYGDEYGIADTPLVKSAREALFDEFFNKRLQTYRDAHMQAAIRDVLRQARIELSGASQAPDTSSYFGKYKLGAALQISMFQGKKKRKRNIRSKHRSKRTTKSVKVHRKKLHKRSNKKVGKRSIHRKR